MIDSDLIFIALSPKQSINETCDSPSCAHETTRQVFLMSRAPFTADGFDFFRITEHRCVLLIKNRWQEKREGFEYWFSTSRDMCPLNATISSSSLARCLVRILAHFFTALHTSSQAALEYQFYFLHNLHKRPIESPSTLVSPLEKLQMYCIITSRGIAHSREKYITKNS